MMLNLLKEFVEVYHRNKGLGELVFTSDCLHVEKPDLSGQLKEFYQHLDFDEEAYFRGALYDLALIPLPLYVKLHQKDGRILAGKRVIWFLLT